MLALIASREPAVARGFGLHSLLCAEQCDVRSRLLRPSEPGASSPC